jgi:N-acetylmuramoyl-L-alanine amidase
VASALKNEHDRADFANRVRADLVIAIHVDSAPSDRPNGLATFYFGDPHGGVHSTGGRALAERIQEELVAQTTLLDCRSHPRTWDLLRMTRMPAVRIDLGYATNPGDAAQHADASFIDAASEGIARALTAFCAPG